jgi:uncharacterized SAM-binding protein YcdF (DUF218 family)
VIRRLIGVAALAWVLGFAVFMLTLAKPLDSGVTTDAIVVPTGGPGRIARGLALIKVHAAQRMLVSGVGPGVRPIDLVLENKAEPALFACCVDLGRDAVDTRSNADETAAWVKARGYKSVRLVTSDWHMPRARMELKHALGQNVTVVSDGVPSDPKLGLLLAEYHKLILRRVALWLGIDGA